LPNAKKIQNAKIKIQNDNLKFKTSLAQSVKRKAQNYSVKLKANLNLI